MNGFGLNDAEAQPGSTDDSEAHDINIHHNYSYGNEGLLEIAKVRNNIFIFVVGAKRQVFSDNGTQVYKKGNYAGQKRHNNIYFSADAHGRRHRSI